VNRRALKDYLIARAQEASTWRGVILLLTSAGVSIKPAWAEIIVAAGLGLAGAVGVAFADRKHKAPPS
jgi:hypothetical protein